MSENAAMTISSGSVPGTFLVDVFPFLKYVPRWVPGAGFQTKARGWRKLQQEMREIPFSEGVKNIVDSISLVRDDQY
jgi:hypothetical protein